MFCREIQRETVNECYKYNFKYAKNRKVENDEEQLSIKWRVHSLAGNQDFGHGIARRTIVEYRISVVRGDNPSQCEYGLHADVYRL